MEFTPLFSNEKVDSYLSLLTRKGLRVSLYASGLTFRSSISHSARHQCKNPPFVWRSRAACQPVWVLSVGRTAMTSKPGKVITSMTSEVISRITSGAQVMLRMTSEVIARITSGPFDPS